MYVSSTAPVPQNSMSPVNPAKAARYNNRKMRVFEAVEFAASRYDCSAPPDAFPGLGVNFQYQVQRAAALLNQIGSPISTATQAQAKSTATGTASAPKVSPLNPVNTNPATKQPVKQVGPWDAPAWGDYSTAYPPICTPGTDILDAIRSHPWIALGSLAALLLAGGVLTAAGVRRYRRRRR